MASAEDFSFDAAQFSGHARLFPLPNLVMFPHVMQPLHIFEPRYRALLQESLADDRMIGMTVLAPGWESDYEGRPPILPVGCLTRIASHQPQADDRSNVLLFGVQRIRIVRELPARHPFREAEVEFLEDLYPAGGVPQRPLVQKKLVQAFRKVLPQLDVSEPLELLLGNELSLGILTDMICYALDLDMAVKTALLADVNVDRRALVLLDHLLRDTAGEQHGRTSDFPPQFSRN